MFELGCHLIDLVVGVIGADSRPTVFHQHLGGDGLSDNTLMVLEKPRLLATVKVSAYEVEGTTRRHLTVCGTRGTFHIQPLDNPTAPSPWMSLADNSKRGYKPGLSRGLLAISPMRWIWLASSPGKKPAISPTSTTWTSNDWYWPAVNVNCALCTMGLERLWLTPRTTALHGVTNDVEISCSTCSCLCIRHLVQRRRHTGGRAWQEETGYRRGQTIAPQAYARVQCGLEVDG